MAAPASEDLRELERLLILAAEQGELRPVASLQEELAMGFDSLSTALDVLREHGKAFEVAPGEWRGPTQEELDTASVQEQEDKRVLVSVPDHPDGDGEDGRPARQPFLSAGVGVVGEPTVRLTKAIADALDAQALGAIVKAGIEEAAGGDEAFVLEVLP